MTLIDYLADVSSSASVVYLVPVMHGVCFILRTYSTAPLPLILLHRPKVDATAA
jgi:hypothetical protein